MASRDSDDQHEASQEEQPLSRSAYRKQQQAEQDAFLKRDRKRVQAEKRYAKQHPQGDPEQAAQVADFDEEKIQRLKHRLNWAIAGLSLGIIIVFLILRFVEF